MFLQACVKNSVHGGRGGEHAWQGGMHGRGHAWQVVCMAGDEHGMGCAWQDRWPLQRTVCILPEKL